MVKTKTVEVLSAILEVILVTCRKNVFPNVTENIFFEILLPKTTPITVEVLYRPPTETNFLEILNMTFDKIDIGKKIYILGDFNKNMYHNNRYIVCDDKIVS